MNREEKRQILVDRYLDLYLRARAVLMDDDDAKDAVQDALVKTLVKHGVRDPFAYCCRTLRTCCADIQRHKSRLNMLDDSMRVVDPERESLLQTVRRLKDKLPLLNRTVMELHYEDDCTVKEIAQKLGVSVAKTKRIISETRDVMRKQLEEEI